MASTKKKVKSQPIKNTTTSCLVKVLVNGVLIEVEYSAEDSVGKISDECAMRQGILGLGHSLRDDSDTLLSRDVLVSTLDNTKVFNLNVMDM
jgi:hypothetical protein